MAIVVADCNNCCGYDNSYMNLAFSSEELNSSFRGKGQVHVAIVIPISLIHSTTTWII